MSVAEFAASSPRDCLKHERSSIQFGGRFFLCATRDLINCQEQWRLFCTVIRRSLIPTCISDRGHFSHAVRFIKNFRNRTVCAVELARIND